ncbi:MAG TPA: hypothetical protein VG267_20190 [Terracidiphilus sp.]|jgi:hypothetical protein|nr:hypothetical protein [Terracidiphilus sp.]
MSIRQWHRHWRITALGAVLCLLAAAFAMEAKLGWYSSNGQARVEFSSIKIQPADAPRQIIQALATSAPASHFPEELPLFLAFAALILVIFVPRPADFSAALAWSSFSPPNFFRPPPRS